MVEYDPISNSFSVSSVCTSQLVQIMWHITHKCRMNCRFCFDSKELAAKEWTWSRTDILEVVRLLKKLDVKKVDISGGEPLRCNEFASIAECCNEYGIHMTVTTSGDGCPHNKRWIVDNWAMFSRVILSLDGLEVEHNYLRRSQDAFDCFSKLYRDLKEHECNRIRINSVITNKVMQEDYPERFARFICSLRPREWCLIRPHRPMDNPSFDSVDISDAIYEEFYVRCKASLRNSEIKLLRRANDMYSSYWTLDARRMLTHNRAEQGYGIVFCTSNLDDIRNNVSTRPQILPKE